MANREHHEVFASELESAIRLLAVLPGAGTPYTKCSTPNYGAFLRKLTGHLYYTFDDQEVIVRALWGAKRERGPNL